MRIKITEEQLKSILSVLNESYLKGINDNEIVAATIIGEAGGEDEDGMKAVFNVLVNRSNKKGTSPAGEALRPKQFSMWDLATANVSTRDDFNVKKILEVIKEKKNHSKWNEALSIAKSNPKDVTGGATHYYAFKGPNKINPPTFSKEWTETVEIGNHKFGIA